MSFGGLSIALTIIFGFLILALIAQLYYFLWWKKKTTTNLDIEKGLFYWVCWKTPCSVHATRSPQITTNHDLQDLELGSNVDGKDLLLKSSGEESLDLELMRLHNLAGPPRFLFTITEETKEDLESEDGKSRKGSLSDLMFTSSVPSSPFKCSLDTLDSYKQQGFNFNPLFEASAESDFNRFRSSPPPKFKFLRDAEEKLYRKLMEESRRKNSSSATVMIQKKDAESKQQLQQYLPQFSSSSSQVLPLASSPTTFKPLENSSMVH